MLTETQLWEGFLSGNREYFLLLYEKYYPTLYFVGLKRNRDASLIKDLIQQQFLYMWENRASLTLPQYGKAYVVQSFLRRLTADWVAVERRNNLEIAWSSMYNLQEKNPEERIIEEHNRTFRTELLKSLIDNLPSRQRELVFMRFYEGLSIDEIVERTSLAHRTVYNKLHEAVKAMKHEIFANPGKYGNLDSVWFLFMVF